MRIRSRSAFLLVLTSALLCACSGERTNRLVGTWDARVHIAEGEPPSGLETASVTVEFAGDGLLTWVIRTPEETREKQGRWRLLYDHGDRMRIETSRPEGLGRKRSQELTVRCDGDDYCNLSRNDNSLLMSLSRV